MIPTINALTHFSRMIWMLGRFDPLRFVYELGTDPMAVDGRDRRRDGKR